MLWKLWRARIWIWDRQLKSLPRQTRNIVVVGTATVLVWAGSWAYGQLLALLRAGEGAVSLAGFVPGALVLLLLFTLIGLADTLNRLYLSDEMEVLLVAPIPPFILFVAKVLESSAALWVPGALLIAVLAGLGQVQHAPVLYYPLAIGSLLSVIGLLTLAGMTLVMLLARFVPPRRARSLLPAALLLVTLLGVAGQRVLVTQVAQFETLVSNLEMATQTPAKLGPILAILVGALLIAGWGSFFVFQRAFYHGWSGLQERATRTTRPRGIRNLLVRSSKYFPSPVATVVRKEWATLFRDPQRWLNIVTVPSMLVVLLLPLLSGRNVLAQLSFWFLLVYGGTFGISAAQGLSLPALAYEGRNIHLLRSSPFSLRTLLKGKFWALWVPTILFWAVVYLGLGLYSGLPLWQSLIAATVIAYNLAGASALGLGISALGTNFESQDPRRSLTPAVAWGGILVIAVFMLMGTLLAILAMIQLLPQSTPVQTLSQALDSFESLSWLFEKRGQVVLALLVTIQAAVWIAIRRLWTVSARCLEQWEF